MKPVDIMTTVLGFHGLHVIRDKMHLPLEICIFSYLTFPNIKSCLIPITEFRNIVPVIFILGS